MKLDEELSIVSPNIDPFIPSTIVNRFANHGTCVITDMALQATR